MKLVENNNLMRQSFSPSFKRIGQKMWIFYQWAIFERVWFFVTQTLYLFYFFSIFFLEKYFVSAIPWVRIYGVIGLNKTPCTYIEDSLLFFIWRQPYVLTQWDITHKNVTQQEKTAVLLIFIWIESGQRLWLWHARMYKGNHLCCTSEWIFRVNEKSLILVIIQILVWVHMWLVGCPNPYKIEQSWECIFLTLFTQMKTKSASKKDFIIHYVRVWFRMIEKWGLPNWRVLGYLILASSQEIEQIQSEM